MRSLTGEKTRDLLVKTALRRFRREGFERTTVSDIAREAGVSRSTIFRYFGSKEDFLFADHAARVGMLRSELAERIDRMSAFDALRESFEALARAWMENRERILATRQVIHSSAALIARDALLHRDWEAVIEDTFLPETGVSAEARFQARVLAGSIMGLIRTGLREWDESGGQTDLVELARQGFALLEDARGVRVPERRRAG